MYHNDFRNNLQLFMEFAFVLTALEVPLLSNSLIPYNRCDNMASARTSEIRAALLTLNLGSV